MRALQPRLPEGRALLHEHRALTPRLGHLLAHLIRGDDGQVMLRLRGEDQVLLRLSVVSTA
eukprot:scaffold97873_cov54-Phaeocystis_antarctica.AAC.2